MFPPEGVVWNGDTLNTVTKSCTRDQKVLVTEGADEETDRLEEEKESRLHLHKEMSHVLKP